jgi:hypothetical protein
MLIADAMLLAIALYTAISNLKFELERIRLVHLPGLLELYPIVAGVDAGDELVCVLLVLLCW